MRLRLVAALPAGVLAGALVTGGLASAANQDVAAQGASGWGPDVVTISQGDSVRWSNSTGFSHNVCVASSGTAAGSNCSEYRSGDVSSTWPSDGYAHRFETIGSFKYLCEIHPGMVGTVTVTAGGTGTTGTGTDTTQTTTTQTGTTQTQTTPAADTTVPSFLSRPKRRASRKALILEVRSSEAATLEATVSRRRPGGRSFARVGQAGVKVASGKNTVKLPRKAAGSLRSGAYRVRLELVDAAGNRSTARTINFKIA